MCSLGQDRRQSKGLQAREHAMMNTPNDTHHGSDTLDTLRITKVTKRAVPGSWVEGTIAGHCFEALVFPEPATCPEFEIGGSNISKFWLADERRNVVASFDRGWDLEPTTEMARHLTDLLAAGLAEFIHSA